MTSKKALDKIYSFALPSSTIETFEHRRCYFENLYNIIKEDLEVLEMLKKYIYYSPKSHCIRMREIRKSTRNFDYEELKDVFKK